MALEDVSDSRVRCGWALLDPLYLSYHDEEWGVPVHDDTRLFEFLILEGAQAGLSWRTILQKREAYRLAFAGFDPEVVARFDRDHIERLAADPGLVRNRLKIWSAVNNARAFLAVQETFGSFDAYLWGFVEGRPIRNAFREGETLPRESSLSRMISKDLKSRGFSFVGPVIVYSYLEAVGVINDHTVDCFRYKAL